MLGFLLEKNMQEILTAIQKFKQPKNCPLIIAISGFSGSGKTTLAAKLKEHLGNTEIVAADDFILHQLKGRDADWSNHDRLRLQKQVLEPASHGKTIHYRRYDWLNDQLSEWRTVPPSQYLVIEGQSVLHPDLRQFYDFKIWIDCTLETAMKRGMRRDRKLGVNHDELWLNIWTPNDRDFLAKYHPDKAADITFNAN
jgi:uridine kinase